MKKIKLLTLNNKNDMKKLVFLPLIVAVAGLLLCTACKKEVDNIKNTEKIDDLKELYHDSTINPIPTSEETQRILNNLLNANTLKDSANTFFCIQTKEEWNTFSNNTNIDLDFDKYTIVYGKIPTFDTSDWISSKKMALIYNTNSYEYEISIQCNDNGFSYLTSLCFWEVYPKFSATISYNVKYIAIKQGIKIETADTDEESVRIVNDYFENHAPRPLDTIFCIQSKDEWLALTNREINLDFDRYSIIYGRTIKPVSMDTIIYQELYYYPQINNYCFNLIMLHRDGYNVVRYLCFWKIYPKINQPILFNKKYIL